MNSKESYRSAKLSVFLVVVIDLLGFGIVLPLLPRYSKDLYSFSSFAPEARGFVIGAIMAIFSLMQFFFAPAWGILSDRVGRRPILLVGLVGSVVFYGLFAFASTLGSDQADLALALLFVSRLGAGIAGATIATAQAVIADCTPPQKRASGMALVGVAFGIGFTLGPLIAALGLWLVPKEKALPGILAAGLSFLALVFCFFKMPETLPAAGSDRPRKGWLSLNRLTETLRMPVIGSLVLVFFLATFGFAMFESTLAVIATDSFQLESYKTLSLLFAYVGFVLMFVQGGFYRPLAKKVPELKLTRWGIILMLGGLVGLAWATRLSPETEFRITLFLISLAVSVAGFAFLTPSVQALISRKASASRQGEVLATNQSFSALARILGPMVGLPLFDKSSVYPYVAGAVVLILVAGLVLQIQRHESENQTEATPPTS